MSIQSKKAIPIALALCLVLAGAAPRAAHAFDLPFDRGHEEPQDEGQQETGQDDEQQEEQQDEQQDNGQDNGQGQEGGQQGNGGNHHGQKDRKYRVDCRYHNDEGIDGIGHCYASAIYAFDRKNHRYEAVKFGVGCDAQTIYNDAGRVHQEELGERISPKTAAFPAVEIQPKGALVNYGTYESVLDIRQGRLAGRCYVHILGDDRFLPFD